MSANGSRSWILNPAGQQASGGWIDDTVAARVAERGLGARTPLAGRFPRQRVEAFDTDSLFESVNEAFHARGWTDGLPIIPPETARVRRMLRGTTLSPGTVLGEVEPLKGLATIEKLAINATMAGCLPEHFPVVIAATEALLDPTFNLRGVQTTDENVAPLLVVGGPIARRIGVNGEFGALGPGWRANAAIGRALRMVMNNLGGGWPGAVSFAGLGQPGRYTLCLAEDEAGSPWEPLHTEAGLPADVSAITLLRAESVINVTGGIEEIASVMGSAASAFSILWSGVSTVIVSPALARSLAADGIDRDGLRERLFRLGRWPADQWRASWLYRTAGGESRYPQWARQAAAQGAIPPVGSPEDLVIVVAGGDVPVAQHAWCPSWGFPACRITRRVDDSLIPPLQTSDS
jgi:hypothetical protein